MSLGLVSHFFSESLLLPFWIKHHRNLVDQAVLINHDSTDNSVEIIKELAPKSWRIVNTRLPDFNAALNDREVEFWETALTTKYKVALNTTEFLWKKDLVQYLDSLEVFKDFKYRAIGMRAFVLVDDKERDYIDLAEPLYKERHHGYKDIYGHRRWRFIHKETHGHYHTGRHGTNLPAAYDSDLFLLYYSLSPWPQCLERKLQIQTRIPESDKRMRLGFSHITTESELRKIYEGAEKNNLLELPEFNEQYNYFVDSYGR